MATPHARYEAPPIATTQITVPSGTVCEIITRLRAIDAMRSEVAALIDGLGDDEQSDLVALARMGRGDGEVYEWSDLREEAGCGRTGSASRYLLSLQQLGDYLEEALGLLGCDCSDLRRH